MNFFLEMFCSSFKEFTLIRPLNFELIERMHTTNISMQMDMSDHRRPNVEPKEKDMSEADHEL